MTIQAKFTLLFFTITSSVILFLSGFIFLFAHHYEFEDFYERLETRLRIAESIHYHRDREGSEEAKKIRQLYLEKLPSEQEYYITVNDTTLSALQQLKIPAGVWQEAKELGSSRYQENNRFYVAKLHTDSYPDTLVVVTATDPYGLEELEHLKFILIAGFVLSIIVVYIAGRKFSGEAFRPFRELVVQMQNITAENLNERLSITDEGDEISNLKETFNGMLERLETAFRTQSNFISNASHELRTPLTIIQGEAEIALQQPGDPKKGKDALSVIHQEAMKLSSILSSLLTLASTGFDGKKLDWKDLRVDEILFESIEKAGEIYPQSKIFPEFLLPEEEESLKIKGNAALLLVAFTNIIINACKYSNNDIVNVYLSISDGRIFITIKDKGIGIPAGDLPSVFEPFFRASNTSGFKGYGIGLPLAKNIIQLHKGHLQINSAEHSGTSVTIQLHKA